MKNNNTTPDKIVKTIVFVGGDKGGVGKSTVARALGEFYRRDRIALVVFDGDDTNPTLSRFIKDAERLYTKAAKGFEPLINNLEGDKPIQLVDLGAGTSLALGQFADQTNFADVAEANGAKITFVFVLAPGADSINLLKLLVEQQGNRMQYVVAKNNAIPGTWDLWDGSKTKAKILGELGGIELTIPILDAETFTLIDRKGLTWTEASQAKEIPLASRSYVFRWVQKVFAEFERAKQFLT
jgi:hypothetical protein